MHIACVKNHGVSYLQLMESYSVIENGIRVQKKRTVLNIGPLAKFDDGMPDYMIRLRQSFINGNPLIPSLAQFVDNAPAKQTLTINYDLNNEQECFMNPQNIGYFLLDALYDSLGIYDVLNKHKSQSKLDYDLNGLAKLLLFGRVLFPDSKLKTFQSRSKYAFGIVNSDQLVEIYRALDVLNQKADAIKQRINYKINNLIGRNTEVCFYDVTNFYFEIGENDPDELDETGNVINQGLRKKGVSKEKRSQPIVQMGLFTDDNGIPISYRLFPGNHIDQTTLRPMMEKSIDSMGFDRIIIVADGGLNSGPNIAHILEGGNGYILSKSTKKSDKKVKAWILEDEGYRWNETKTFKVKSIIRKRKIKDAFGNEKEIEEKLISYWSKKHYDRECHENANFIEYLKSAIENPDKLKDKQKKIEKFLIKDQVSKETGEIVKTSTQLSLDMDKIQEYMDLMGYYTIMSSEIEKSDEEIISKYHGLSRIEDSFRITKSDLEGRPVYVWKPEHINAHFLICFIALTMLRVIQYWILKHQGKDTLNMDGWESGLSASRIQTALKDWQADALPGGYYRLTKVDEDLRQILEAFQIKGDLRLPSVKEMNQLKYSIDKNAKG
jgi:transposase